MKIGFFGTPDIAAYYLDRLSEKHKILFAVTGEDKPKGRHGTPVYCETKQIAVKKDIPVYQPTNLLDHEFIKQIAGKNADIFVVVAYGKIIPECIFNMPPLKTVNVHPSLLPRYRGAAPVQWALINGETETGITIQYINEKLDAGNIVAQKKIPLDTGMTADDLFRIVYPQGFDLLIEALDKLASGNATTAKQNDSEATFCGKIGRETAHIDWRKNSEEIHNLVRGLNPKPTAWTEFKNKNIKIYKTKLVPIDPPNTETNNTIPELKPGFLAGHKKKLFVGTGNGVMEILELQPETKKVMDGTSFINGYRLASGDSFAAC